MAKKSEADPAPVDHNTDRYPTLQDVLAAVQMDAEIPDVAIERLEVTCLASGEATYRFWRAREEDSEGGYLPVA